MAELPTTARVVIIGGGAVGVSSLYHLAKAGWTDCVLFWSSGWTTRTMPCSPLFRQPNNGS